MNINKVIEDKNENQLKAIENQKKKELYASEKNNQLKNDGIKSIVLLKDWLEESIKSYLTSFSTFVKLEIKQFQLKKKILTTKNVSRDFF